MKKLAVSTYIVAFSCAVLRMVTMQAAANAPRVLQAQDAYELGYQAGYTTSNAFGRLGGIGDRRDNVSEKNQRRTLSFDLLDMGTDEALSDRSIRDFTRQSAVRFADVNAENAFKRGYRAGYGAGWTDGHQVGYAMTPVQAAADDGSAQALEGDFFAPTASTNIPELSPEEREAAIKANADFFRGPGSQD